MYDLIVLGGGPAGYMAAQRAGALGLKTLLIEKAAVGGVCLNEGCIPTKTLLYSAKLYDNAVNSKKYGVSASDVSIDHATVVKRKNKVVKTLVAGIKSALKANSVELIIGNGIIEGKEKEGFTVSVDANKYTGKRLLIATGSGPLIPPVSGLDEGLTSGFVITSKEALNLTAPPESLAVIGGGVIGLEMAAYYLSLGTKVTIIEMQPNIAGDADADLVGQLMKHYEKKGISFILNARVNEIKQDGLSYISNGEQSFLQSDKVLLAIGRAPNIAGFGLENINVYTERGAIVTDERMKTNIPEVYAAGDVNGKSKLAHTAYREAEVAINNIAGLRDKMRYDAIPNIIYTNPELSSVGMTEAQAKSLGLDIEAISIPLRFSGRYVAENDGGDSMAKLIVNRQTKTILGFHALCNYSSEFIVAAACMIEKSMTLDDIKKVVFPHPTVSEIIREALFLSER